MSSRSSLIVSRGLAVAALALVLAACSTLNGLGALLGNEVRFTPMQLQASLDRNFPKHYDKLGGLVSLTLLNPRLTIRKGRTDCASTSTWAWARWAATAAGRPATSR